MPQIMDFLQKILENVINRIKDQLLLFAITIIILILFFPEQRFQIFGAGLVFAIIYAIIKIKTSKPNSVNSDVIPAEDWPVIKRRILENLKNDSQKLESLIPFLQDESNMNFNDLAHMIDAPDKPLLDRLRHLTLTPRSDIDNEEEINLIRQWLGLREQVNKQISRKRRTEYINKNASLLRESISMLIEFYE